MPFEGMDVDQAQGLASRLDANARMLADIAGLMTGLASGLTLSWCGPGSAAFEQRWLMTDRPALLAAAQALADAHARLVANIEQQQTASAATGGGAGVRQTVERLWNDAGTVSTVLGLGAIPVSLLMKGSRLDEAFDHAGYVGTAMGAVSVGIDAFKTGEDLGESRYADALNQAADGLTDGLKAYPNPVVWGIGVDATLLHDDLNLDWKAVPSPFSWANLKNDYLPVGEWMGTGGFWEQAAETLWGAMN